MAFGESFGSVLDRTSQVERQKNWQVGKLGETVFETTDSPVAVSILYIFEVSHLSSCLHETNGQTLPLKSFFPAASHFFTRLGPTYRRHTNVLDGFLKDKLAASRAKARTLGMFPCPIQAWRASNSTWWTARIVDNRRAEVECELTM